MTFHTEMHVDYNVHFKKWWFAYFFTQKKKSQINFCHQNFSIDKNNCCTSSPKDESWPYKYVSNVFVNNHLCKTCKDVFMEHAEFNVCLCLTKKNRWWFCKHSKSFQNFWSKLPFVFSIFSELWTWIAIFSVEFKKNVLNGYMCSFFFMFDTYFL